MAHEQIIRCFLLKGKKHLCNPFMHSGHYSGQLSHRWLGRLWFWKMHVFIIQPCKIMFFVIVVTSKLATIKNANKFCLLVNYNRT